MLSTAKPILQNDLKKLLESAAYDAYMELLQKNQVSEAGNDDEIEKEHKKLKRIVKPKKNVVKKEQSKVESEIPAWFNKEQEVEETTREEQEELTKILNELV